MSKVKLFFPPYQEKRPSSLMLKEVWYNIFTLVIVSTDHSEETIKLTQKKKPLQSLILEIRPPP